jgi:predicted MFS family arabinose efflux permease
MKAQVYDPALQAALIGMAGLATAMGIGRFAFTPMLPLMQLHDLVSLRQGSYLASANYVGYLLGALLLFAFNPPPARAAKFGLAVVAASTLAMAFTSSFSPWVVLRLIAGVASAFVLIGVSGWAMGVLAAHDRPGWTGWVFAGVGAGILFAGAVVLAIGATDLTPAVGWIVLGAAACCVALLAALLIEDMVPSRAVDMATPGVDACAWRLIICYGGFGFGYIIPATFLPAAARSMISDPTVFCWIWPLFGIAAASSTALTSSILGNLQPRRAWTYGQFVMAFGVTLPAVQTTLFSIIVSAICVGGTFMVITMAGMQEARRIAAQSAPRLMAAMTAAFAAGQLVGPLTLTAVNSAVEAICRPSLFAASILFITALALLPNELRRRELHADAITRDRL